MGDGDRKPSLASTISGTLSDQGLVGIKSRAAFFKRRTKRERKLVIILAILILILIIVIILLAVVSQRYNRLKDDCKICTSEACVSTAARYLQSMDLTVDPCEDFYQFVCGRWGEHHPIPERYSSYSWYSILQEEIDRRIIDALEQEDSDEDPNVVAFARKINKNCLDTGALDKLGIKPMKNILKALNLPTPTPSGTEDAEEFNLTTTMALAKRNYDIDLIVSLDIVPIADNRSYNEMILSISLNQSPLPGVPYYEFRPSTGHHHGGRPGPWSKRSAQDDIVLAKVEEEEILSTVQKYAASVMSYVYNEEKGVPTTSDDFKKVASDIYELEKSIYEIFRKNTTDNVTETSIDGLQLEWNNAIDDEEQGHLQVDWLFYFTTIFEGIEVFDLNKTISYSSENIQELAKVLAQAKPTVLKNYLWWQVARILSPYTDKTMRGYKENYLEELYEEKYIAPSRTVFCSSAVKTLLPNVVSYFLVDDTTKAVKYKVKEIMSSVVDSFMELLKGLDWMDGETKEACREKARNMVVSIAFPDYVLSWYTLDEKFSGMIMHGDDLLGNMLAVKNWKLQKKLESLFEENDRSGWDDGEAVAVNVNAFHSPGDNAIVVPMGILYQPFFNLGLNVLDFAAVASTLGHELTHGFDNIGRKFDKEGNYRQWWTEKTIQEYEDRVKCFEMQYSEYLIKEINATVDGERTLGENIADNGGLRQAWMAYRRYRKKHGPEPRLPGLEQFNNDQMFFIAYSGLLYRALRLATGADRYTRNADIHEECKIKTLQERWRKMANKLYSRLPLIGNPLIKQLGNYETEGLKYKRPQGSPNIECRMSTVDGLTRQLRDVHSPTPERILGAASNLAEFADVWGCKKGSPMNPKRKRCIVW